MFPDVRFLIGHCDKFLTIFYLTTKLFQFNDIAFAMSIQDLNFTGPKVKSYF
jgi:hypothetical protein